MTPAQEGPEVQCSELLADRLNPYRAGTELTRFYLVSIMAADALAPYITRTSAAMILII